MPAPVKVVAVDRGNFGVLGGRTGPDGIPERPSQAVIDYRTPWPVPTLTSVPPTTSAPASRSGWPATSAA